jgi:cytochrome P450
VATAARLIAARQHPTYAMLHTWLVESMPPNTLARLGAHAQAIVRARLELVALRGRSNFDLIQEISEPLWPDVLAAWMGLADQQRRRLHHSSRALGVLSDLGELSPRRLAGVVSALDELRRMFTDTYRYPRYTHAVPNLFAALETGWAPALGPIEDEAVFAAMQLLLVGSEASVSFIAPLIETLLQRPKLIAALRMEPASIVTFVEEKQAHFARGSGMRHGMPSNATAFEFVWRLLAKTQAAAVIEALLCGPIEIEADKQPKCCQTRGDGTRRLDHLGLRLRAQSS